MYTICKHFFYFFFVIFCANETLLIYTELASVSKPTDFGGFKKARATL